MNRHNAVGKNMSAIMANHHGGALLIYRPSEGITIEIPSKAINKTNGSIKKKITARLSELTAENLIILKNKYGVQCATANDVMVR